MIRVLIILLLGIASGYAADPPKLPIESAEQALSYFREARGDLLASLSEDRRKFVIHVSTAAHGLLVKRWWADDKHQLKHDPKLQGDQSPIFGSLAAVENSKTDTWSLYYNAGMQAFVVYLDSVSGKVLYLYSIPEG
jgi:hypothetical protein